MPPTELTLEQQAHIRYFETQVDRMSEQQAKEFLLQLYRHHTLETSMYKSILKQNLTQGFYVSPEQL